MKQKIPKLIKKGWHKYYKEKKTLEQSSEEIGMNRGTFYWNMKHYGLPTRTQSQSIKLSLDKRKKDNPTKSTKGFKKILVNEYWENMKSEEEVMELMELKTRTEFRDMCKIKFVPCRKSFDEVMGQLAKEIIDMRQDVLDGIKYSYETSSDGKVRGFRKMCYPNKIEVIPEREEDEEIIDSGESLTDKERKKLEEAKEEDKVIIEL